MTLPSSLGTTGCSINSPGNPVGHFPGDSCQAAKGWRSLPSLKPAGSHTWRQASALSSWTRRCCLHVLLTRAKNHDAALKAKGPWEPGLLLVAQCRKTLRQRPELHQDTTHSPSPTSFTLSLYTVPCSYLQFVCSKN